MPDETVETALPDWWRKSGLEEMRMTVRGGCLRHGCLERRLSARKLEKRCKDEKSQISLKEWILQKSTIHLKKWIPCKLQP